jgi:uncharacterized OB-fold protein
MAEWEKFKPVPTEDTEKYWEYVAQGELRMPRCGGCGLVFFPPAALCPRCLSEKREWIKLSGRGKVFSYAVFHHAFYPAYSEDVPYNTAIIELSEGPRLHANVTGCDNDELYIGLPVSVWFDKVDDEVTLPKFKPAR